MRPRQTRRGRHVGRATPPAARHRAVAGPALALTVAALAIATQSVAPSPASGAASAAAGRPVAQFNRMTVSDTASVSDPHLQVAVVQGGGGGRAYVAWLRRHHPGIRILLYKTMWWLRPTDAHGDASCLPGRGRYPASWYLHTASGARVTWNAGTSETQYAMDFGNPGYAAACARRLAASARAGGADGVMLDGAPTSLYWAQLSRACRSATCANDTNWHNRMAAALSAIARAMHSRHLVVYANISGGNIRCCSGGPGVWRRYMSILDGGMEESWTYGTNHLPVRSSQVRQGIRNVAWAEAHGKYMLVNDDITNCESCSAYGLAVMLLATRGHVTYDTANGSYRGGYGPWWPIYAGAQALGPATAPARTLRSGLHFRRFRHGYVVVNIDGRAIRDRRYGWVAAYSAQIR